MNKLSQDFEESDSDSYIDIKDFDNSFDFCDTNSGIFWGKQTEDEKKFVQHFKSSDRFNQNIGPNDGTNEEQVVINGSEEQNSSQCINENQIQEVMESTEVLEPIISESINDSFDETKQISLEDMRCDSDNEELSDIEDNQLTNLAINCSFNYSKTKLIDANNNEDIPLESNYEETTAKDTDSHLSSEESNNMPNISIDFDLKVISNSEPKEDIKTTDPVIDDSSIKSSIDTKQTKSDEYIIDPNEDMTEANVSHEIDFIISGQMIGTPSVSQLSMSLRQIESQLNKAEELPTVEPELNINSELILMDSSDKSCDNSSDTSSDISSVNEKITEQLIEDNTRINSNLNQIQSSINSIKETFDSRLNPLNNESVVAQPISSAQNGEQLASSLESISEDNLWSNSQETNFQEFLDKYLTDPGFNPLSESQESDQFPEFN